VPFPDSDSARIFPPWPSIPSIHNKNSQCIILIAGYSLVSLLPAEIRFAWRFRLVIGDQLQNVRSVEAPTPADSVSRNLPFGGQSVNGLKMDLEKNCDVRWCEDFFHCFLLSHAA